MKPNPLFEPKTKKGYKLSASASLKKTRKRINWHLPEIMVILIIIIVLCIYLSQGSYEMDGHLYKRLGPYNTIHDPDCPCNIKENDL